MDIALSEMRIDQKVKLKSLHESENPLLRKRMLKQSVETKTEYAVEKTRNNSSGHADTTDEESTML
jgi:hypothetical protein